MDDLKSMIHSDEKEIERVCIPDTDGVGSDVRLAKVRRCQCY